MEEWPIAAGLIGLTRVLGKENIEIQQNGILLKADDLSGFASKYIYKLIDTFSVVERDVKRMSWYVNQLNKYPDKTKQYASEIRKTMNDQFKKIEKYFGDTTECNELKDLVEQLKNIKDENDLPIVMKAVESYRNIVSTSFINEKLTINYVKSVILTPFFGQTSILQKSFTHDTQEHIKKIEEDFIKPAMYELKYNECLITANNYEQVYQFLEKNQDVYQPFKNWLKEVKKLDTIEKVKNYFLTDNLLCSFIEGLPATQTYEELVFSPLAFSNSKAVNFNWNFEKKQPVPISAVARLIMFIAPLGLSFYSRKRGSTYANETLRFAGLILSQQSFQNIISDNNTYQQLRAGGSTFEEAIVGVLQESLDKADKIKKSYVFLEVHSDYQSKKTLLDYYHMPSYLTNYLSKYGKALTLLHQRELRDTFLRTVLKGIDPKQVIFDYLREAVKDSYHGEGAYHATRERKRIINAKEGVMEMGKNDKLISFIYYRGVELREALFTDRKSDDENSPYRASGRKKLEGIAYRLINSVKAGNKQAFMDTIFRLYISTNDEKVKLPNVFIDAFKEEGLDFETIASAFISGLLSQETSKKEESVTNG